MLFVYLPNNTKENLASNLFIILRKVMPGNLYGAKMTAFTVTFTTALLADNSIIKCLVRFSFYYKSLDVKSNIGLTFFIYQSGQILFARGINTCIH